LIVLDYPSTSYLLTSNLLLTPLTLSPSQLTSRDSRVHDALPTHLRCRMTENVCAIDLHRKSRVRATCIVCDDELDPSFEVRCDEVSRVLAGAAGDSCSCENDLVELLLHDTATAGAVVRIFVDWGVIHVDNRFHASLVASTMNSAGPSRT